jgi:hypothetical protein
MMGKGVNRCKAVPIHSIRSSGIRRHSPSGRWLWRRPVMRRLTPSPTIYSVRSLAGELRRNSRRVVGVQLDIRFRNLRLPALWPLASEA